MLQDPVKAFRGAQLRGVHVFEEVLKPAVNFDRVAGDLPADCICTGLVDLSKEECLNVVVQNASLASRVEIAPHEGQLRPEFLDFVFREDLAVVQELGGRRQIEDMQLELSFGQKATLVPLRDLVVVASGLLRHERGCLNNVKTEYTQSLESSRSSGPFGPAVRLDVAARFPTTIRIRVSARLRLSSSSP